VRVVRQFDKNEGRMTDAELAEIEARNNTVIESSRVGPPGREVVTIALRSPEGLRIISAEPRLARMLLSAQADVRQLVAALRALI
jgi:hypothetical protein